MKTKNRLTRVSKYLASNGLYKEAADIKKLAEMVDSDDAMAGDEPSFPEDDKLLDELRSDHPFTWDGPDPLQPGGMSTEDEEAYEAAFNEYEADLLKMLRKRKQEDRRNRDRDRLFDILQGQRRWGGNQ